MTLATGAAKKAKMSGKRALFPRLDLPLSIPFAPMEAEVTEEIPKGDGWQYEPKWDGFRAIVFRKDDDVVVQSKSGQPLGRYFPEIVEAIRKLKPREFILDGELLIQSGGKLSFDDLQLRLHPAESRIRKLAGEIPAQYFVFDILYEPKRGGGNVLVDEPLRTRRAHLVSFFERNVSDEQTVKLSPATTERKIAQQWFEHFGPLGLDGVMAKPLDQPYHSGDRKGMLKVKHFRTADCVVGGFRYSSGSRAIATLALGLYDDEGILQHVGNTSGFDEVMRKELERVVEPLAGGKGFDGKIPGQSRWSKGSSEFVPVDPRLVCEVRYDYFTSDRFRHATRFLRWRPEKSPESCTFDQLIEKQKSKKKIVFPF